MDLQTTFFRLVILVKKDNHTDHYDILDVERGIHYHTFPCPLFLLKAHVPQQRLSLATAPGHGWRSPKYLKHLHGKVADLASGFVREWMGNMLLGRDWHVFQQEIPFLKHDARHPGYGVQIIYYMFTHTYIYTLKTHQSYRSSPTCSLCCFSHMFFIAAKMAITTQHVSSCFTIWSTMKLNTCAILRVYTVYIYICSI